jgi:hypothetical protein
MLAWGIVENRAAYVSTGQLDTALDQLKWATDYFIKAHPSANELYGQIGTGGQDHAWWGPAEVMQMARPAFRITSTCPVRSCRETPRRWLQLPSRSARRSHLREHAAVTRTPAVHVRRYVPRQILRLHQRCAGLLQLVERLQRRARVGRIWLYRATNETAFLDKAQSYYANLSNQQQTTIKSYKWTHAWDDKSYGSYVLLAKAHGPRSITTTRSVGSTGGRWVARRSGPTARA